MQHTNCAATHWLKIAALCSRMLLNNLAPVSYGLKNPAVQLGSLLKYIIRALVGEIESDVPNPPPAPGLEILPGGITCHNNIIKY